MGKFSFYKNLFSCIIFHLYVELFGPDVQPANFPAKVHLKLRHRNSSYFRSGDNSIKKYIQRLEPRSIKFDRLTITNEEKCQERKIAGENTGIKGFAATCVGSGINPRLV